MSHQKGMLVGCLFVVTLLAYVPAIRGGFIWDDNDYVTKNPTLLDFAGLRAIWLDPSATPQYYPLVHSSYWIEYRLWGLNATGYHIVNVLIHIFNALLLWRILTRFSIPAAWFAAFVFAIHPVHVESVAWITERKNVLSGFFYLSAVLCFLRYWDFTRSEHDEPKRNWGWYLASHLCFIGALLSKTVVATLPAALLVMIWWKRGRVTAKDVAALAPMFVLGISLGLLTVWLEKYQVGASGIDWELSPVERCLIAGRAIWFYAAKLVWPLDLIFTYPRWTIDSSQAWQYIFPAGVVAVMLAFWMLRDRIGRGPLAAVCFFCGSLFPALGFFDVYPMRFSFVADHFQYLASIGVIVLVVATAHLTLKRMSGSKTLVPIAIAGLVAMVLTSLTWQQGKIYEGHETLFRDTLAKNPDSFMAHNNLGVILNGRGDFVEAEEHLRFALKIKPDFVELIVNLATALEGQGKLDEAIRLYGKGAELDPAFAPAFNGLGAVYGAKGEFELAETNLMEALRLNPNYAISYTNLASVYAGQDKTELAIENYEKAIELDPELTDARLNLARVLMSTEDNERAQEVLKSCLKQNPENISALLNLGVIAANESRYQTAIHYFENILKLDEKHVAATYNLSAMYDAIGNPMQAARYMDEYRRLSGQ